MSVIERLDELIAEAKAKSEMGLAPGVSGFPPDKEAKGEVKGDGDWLANLGDAASKFANEYDGDVDPIPPMDRIKKFISNLSAQQKIELVSLPLIPKTDVWFEKSRATESRAYLESLKVCESRMPGEQNVFRFVDIGADQGLFAAFAGVRWPYAYVDCYEGPSSLASRQCLRRNAQTGTKYFSEIPKIVPPCDALHVGIGDHVKNLQFDEPTVFGLRVVFWEFDTAETLENATGFLRTFGMKLAMMSSFVDGARGWQLWVRPRS